MAEDWLGINGTQSSFVPNSHLDQRSVGVALGSQFIPLSSGKKKT